MAESASCLALSTSQPLTFEQAGRRTWWSASLRSRAQATLLTSQLVRQRWTYSADQPRPRSLSRLLRCNYTALTSWLVLSSICLIFQVCEGLPAYWARAARQVARAWLSGTTPDLSRWVSQWIQTRSRQDMSPSSEKKGSSSADCLLYLPSRGVRAESLAQACLTRYIGNGISQVTRLAVLLVRNLQPSRENRVRFSFSLLAMRGKGIGALYSLVQSCRTWPSSFSCSRLQLLFEFLGRMQLSSLGGSCSLLCSLGCSSRVVSGFRVRDLTLSFFLREVRYFAICSCAPELAAICYLRHLSNRPTSISNMPSQGRGPNRGASKVRSWRLGGGKGLSSRSMAQQSWDWLLPLAWQRKASPCRQKVRQWCSRTLAPLAPSSSWNRSVLFWKQLAYCLSCRLSMMCPNWVQKLSSLRPSLRCLSRQSRNSSATTSPTVPSEAIARMRSLASVKKTKVSQLISSANRGKLVCTFDRQLRTSRTILETSEKISDLLLASLLRPLYLAVSCSSRGLRRVSIQDRVSRTARCSAQNLGWGYLKPRCFSTARSTLSLRKKQRSSRDASSQSTRSESAARDLRIVVYIYCTGYLFIAGHLSKEVSYSRIAACTFSRVLRSSSPSCLSSARTPARIRLFHLFQKGELVLWSTSPLDSTSSCRMSLFCLNFQRLALYITRTLTRSQSLRSLTWLPASQQPIPGPDARTFSCSSGETALQHWKQFSELQYSLPSTTKLALQKLSVPNRAFPATLAGPPILKQVLIVSAEQGLPCHLGRPSHIKIGINCQCRTGPSLPPWPALPYQISCRYSLAHLDQLSGGDLALRLGLLLAEGLQGLLGLAAAQGLRPGQLPRAQRGQVLLLLHQHLQVALGYRPVVGLLPGLEVLAPGGLGVLPQVDRLALLLAEDHARVFLGDYFGAALFALEELELGLLALQPVVGNDVEGLGTTALLGGLGRLGPGGFLGGAPGLGEHFGLELAAVALGVDGPLVGEDGVPGAEVVEVFPAEVEQLEQPLEAGLLAAAADCDLEELLVNVGLAETELEGGAVVPALDGGPVDLLEPL